MSMKIKFAQCQKNGETVSFAINGEKQYAVLVDEKNYQEMTDLLKEIPELKDHAEFDSLKPVMEKFNYKGKSYTFKFYPLVRFDDVTDGAKNLTLSELTNIVRQEWNPDWNDEENEEALNWFDLLFSERLYCAIGVEGTKSVFAIYDERGYLANWHRDVEKGDCLESILALTRQLN